MRIVIDDLIVLGRACPEPLKDGRVTVCLGGYSHKWGFVRIYPTRTNMKLQRWDIASVEVERDARDTRAESWKIAGSKTDWNSLAEKVEVVGRFPQTKWADLVYNLTDSCVQDINLAHRSLGIVKPTVIKAYFAINPHYGQLFQPLLPGLGESTSVKRDFEHEPRVKYRCQDCRTKGAHDQQVLEWGFYEWVRKNPNSIEQVWENAKFDSPKHDLFFFVGNQQRYRTSFLIISVLRVPKGGSAQLPLTSYMIWTQDSTFSDIESEDLDACYQLVKLTTKIGSPAG